MAGGTSPAYAEALHIRFARTAVLRFERHTMVRGARRAVVPLLYWKEGKHSSLRAYHSASQSCRSPHAPSPLRSASARDDLLWMQHAQSGAPFSPVSCTVLVALIAQNPSHHSPAPPSDVLPAEGQ
ncbi:hypothetical protein PsYK624_151880 [Phanerochaete sordida]|uniref:Uncharacterized protein n=1 Tax=Phanerochaete sordida TaxID=48140 RepID=A0A9P3LL24_9APHY|nr:hypothetical protein PsYK624_151880 [Phanerochaete sordida]